MIIDADRVNQCALLSEAQRQCLRMVGELHTSKEIAIRLGISPHTVDARLRRIIEKLGVSSRAQAAKMLTKYEAQYQPLICQSIALDDMGNPEDKAASTASLDLEYPVSDQFESGNFTIHDGCVERNEDIMSEWTNESRSYRTAGASEWDRINRLGRTQRVTMMVMIAAISALSFGGLISGVVALQAIVP